jgi:hypothetical protein
MTHRVEYQKVDSARQETHIKSMEQTVALGVVVATIAFVAIYAISVWKSSGPRK